MRGAADTLGQLQKSQGEQYDPDLLDAAAHQLSQFFLILSGHFNAPSIPNFCRFSRSCDCPGGSVRKHRSARNYNVKSSCEGRRSFVYSEKSK
jgi:hypothetical protein